MGIGCSKGTAEIVAVDARPNINKTQCERVNAEKHTPATSEDIMDLPVTSGTFNVKTLARHKVIQDFQKESERVSREPPGEPATQDVPSQNADSLLSSWSVKHPAVTEILNLTHYHFKALRDALNGANLSSKAAFDQVKGLFSVYFKHKNPKNRTIVTEFAVALGVPKLAFDMIVDRRNNHRELTTWDREVENRSATVAISENQIEALKMSQDVTSQLLAAVLNFTDLNDKFSLACGEVGFVPLLVDVTKELQDSIPHNVKYVNDETQELSNYTVRGKMLSRVLGILHNLSKRVPIRRSFAACQAVNVLIPLLKAEVPVVLYNTKTLLILAYLIDEENNHLIMTDKGPIKFLVGLLKKALVSQNHRYIGFSAAEIAEGLTQIAVNDSNKKTIGQSGAVSVLVSMLQKAQGDDERIEACRTLWTLAFDDENKQEIKGNKLAIAELEKLHSSENKELRRAAAGALWECQGKEKYAEEKQLSVTAQETTDTKHVMISYQWDVQQSMIQLKNQLQAKGYKVWMDIDEMGGSTLESMASAVENASVVLVGVSQKYKESPNCRSEAEYTYQLHKDIVPLMMDYKYKPDGWLGIIVGSKLWIDFSERHKLEININKLIKELGNRGKIASQETIQAATTDLVDASPQTSIRSWKNSDVLNWLEEVGLQGRVDSNAVQRLDGRMLLRLQDLRKESPEFFYTSIRTDLKLANVFDVLEFTDQLDQLAT